jgi:hypothetical protein
MGEISPTNLTAGYWATGLEMIPMELKKPVAKLAMATGHAVLINLHLNRSKI